MDIKNNSNVNKGFDDNNDNGGDIRGKFSDRIKKIRRDRLKRRKNTNIDLELEEENVIRRSGRNIFKIILAIPSVVYTNVKKNNDIDSSSVVDEVLLSNSVDSELNKKRTRVNKIREINVSLLRENKKIYLKNHFNENEILLKETQKTYENEIKIEKLQKEIIDLIKKRLVKNLNELEVLQSELYVISELTGDRIRLKDCEEDIKEIKKLLSKIKALKEKYDYLKDNVDFEYMLEHGEDFLVDKILELKNLCSLDDVRYVVDNYKILDEYKYLYLKIDKLADDTIKLEDYKEKETLGLKERDFDFENFKIDVYDVDRENSRYNDFVKKQELFLRNLEDKISHIDSRENVTYRLKGFNQLLGNSFKYLGLLLVSPLKGLIPGIATQTLVTKNLIHNLYNNLEWEEKRKMVYEAIDYADSIKIAINNLDDTSNLVNSTLEDVVKLKNKYKKEFSKYGGELSDYRDAIKKINKMENAILGSKIKIDLMKTRMKEKEKQNSDKMRLVRKFNSSQNN